MMLPTSLSTSATSGTRSAQDAATNQGFFTGAFTVAQSGSKASGSDPILLMVLAAAAVWLLMRKR